MSWFRRLFGNRSEAAAPAPAHDATGSTASACAHGDIDALAARELRADSPEFDLFIARRELELGTNLPHGALHLANLLLVDPAQSAWLALATGYADAARAGIGIDALVPDIDPRHASTEALRAWLWHAEGRLGDAALRLADVVQATHEAAPLHAWALEWLEPEGAIESVPASQALRIFGVVLTHCHEAAEAPAPLLAKACRWHALLERAVPGLPDDGMLRLLRAGLARKAGRIDEALIRAGELAQAREFNQAAAIGLALRARGDFIASAKAFERGIELDPDNVAGYLEAGDSWLKSASWHQALTAYEAALAVEPGNAWAEPSSWYCRWKLEGNESWTTRMVESDLKRARSLLFLEFGGIALSGDAIAGIARQLREAWAEKPPEPDPEGEPLRVKTSSLESPSNLLALRLECEVHGPGPPIELDAGAIPSPDPRLSVAEVAWPLWRYEGVMPRPALDAPAPDVLARIAALAMRRYDPQANWAQASHVAVELGAARVADVLGVIVHPPALPAGVDALAWLARLQEAAAMVAGQLDDGWQGSTRREALRSLLLGPSDWATAAGIRVLARIARDERALAQDIDRLFRQREKAMPDLGHWDWIEVLYREWQTLPWLFDHEREALAQKARAEARAKQDTQAPASPGEVT